MVIMISFPRVRLIYVIVKMVTEDVSTSTDCTLCGRCVEACPEKALSFAIKK